MINSFNNRKHYNIVLIGSLPSYLGAKQHSGLGNVVWGLAKELKHQSINFAILAKGRYFYKFRRVEGVDIYGLGFSFKAIFRTVKSIISNINEISNVKSFKNKLRLFYAIYFLLFFDERLKYKLIHLHHISNQFPLATRILGFQQPIVAHVHSYSNIFNCKNIGQRKRETQNTNLQLTKVDFVIHVSKSLKEQGLEYGIKWECEDKVLYNGIKYDINTLNKFTNTKSKNVICFVGAFLPIKGINLLLEGMKDIRLKNVKILWIGDGILKKRIAEFCEKNKIDYTITGLIHNEKVLELISESSLLVVPSKSESFGQIYIEAMLMGTPSIGYHKVINEFNSTFGLGLSKQKILIPFDHSKESSRDLSNKIQEQLENNSVIDLSELRTNILNKIHWSNLIRDYIKIYNRFI